MGLFRAAGRHGREDSECYVIANSKNEKEKIWLLVFRYHNMSQIKFIDEVDIKNKRVLIRVDFNVSLTDKLTIADDARIRQAVPTLNHLLNNGNKLIIVSHLGRPKGRDPHFSLKVVAAYLKGLLPGFEITLVDDFLHSEDRQRILNQGEKEIIMLENIRFYNDEKAGDEVFAKKLSELADVYVNDAFGVSHRTDASVYVITKFLPSYGGLLLKKEISMISKAIKNPKKPVVAIIGGAKISTKIALIGRLIELADYLIVGGALANAFFCAQGYDIGKSYCEYEKVESARKLLFMAAQKNTAIVLPVDMVIGDAQNKEASGSVAKISEIPPNSSILDIGPETQARYGMIIDKANTIIWNGPIGYIENPIYARGTDFVYYAITQNSKAVSIVGGGDTLAAISKKEYLDKITHISTGGGAMLEFIEKGTLPGIEALSRT